MLGWCLRHHPRPTSCEDRHTGQLLRGYIVREPGTECIMPMGQCKAAEIASSSFRECRLSSRSTECPQGTYVHRGCRQLGF